MKTLLAATALLLLGLPLHAQKKEDPQYFQITRTLAQKLVDELPKRYPDVQCGLVHALLFDGQHHACIASYKLEQVGEADEDEDNIVSDDQCLIVNPRVNEKFVRCNIRLPIKDSSGNLIRASWAFYIKTKPGDDMAKLLARAIEIRDDLAKDVPSLKALFAPPPAG